MPTYTLDTYEPQLRKHGSQFVVDGKIYTVAKDNFILIDENGAYCLPSTLEPFINQAFGKFCASGCIPQWIADDTRTREPART